MKNLRNLHSLDIGHGIGYQRTAETFIKGRGWPNEKVKSQPIMVIVIFIQQAHKMYMSFFSQYFQVILFTSFKQ